jgi:hypothetical protein
MALHIITIGGVVLVSKDRDAINKIFNLVGPAFPPAEVFQALLNSTCDGETIRERIERDLRNPDVKIQSEALAMLERIDRG